MRCWIENVHVVESIDAPMHLNQGRFLQNGRCGYVLQPEFMRSESYNPYDANTLKGVVEPIVLSVTVSAVKERWSAERNRFVNATSTPSLPGISHVGSPC